MSDNIDATNVAMVTNSWLLVNDNYANVSSNFTVEIVEINSPGIRS